MKALSEPKPRLALLAETRAGLDKLGDTSGVEWLFCCQTGDSLFDFYKGDAIVSSINLDRALFDLPDLVGIIFVGGVEAFEKIQLNWRSKLPSIVLAFRQIPEANLQAILTAGIECIADVLTTQRRHSGHAALELATYRREFDRLQRSFSRLEEYVGGHSFQRATEVFEYPPDLMTATESSGRASLEGDRGGRYLIQYLPVDSLGVSSLSVHISAKPKDAETLVVKLRAIETEQTFAIWSIRSEEVQIGWVELALHHAIDERALSLEMVVEWPHPNNGWALTLGPPHPYKEFCAHTEASEYLSAPLALRIFSSLPGVRVPATTTALRPIDSPHVLAEFVPFEAYETVMQTLPAVPDNKPTLVFYDKEIGCITVHPRVGGLTVARMNVAVPKHAWAVSAQIHLAHERASPTQFGILICALRDERRELARLDHLEVASQTFSGWKRLSPLETKSISVMLAFPEDQLSLYLVTRQAPDSSPDFAWARFSKLEFNVLPKSIIAEKETDELTPVEADVAHSSKISEGE